MVVVVVEVDVDVGGAFIPCASLTDNEPVTDVPPRLRRGNVKGCTSAAMKRCSL